ncbi:MAG: VWA domain-containing protein, partial [Planctomycetes bacterium]|nr:VWA domain-containing protein [Planctomycetota bacterium]
PGAGAPAAKGPAESKERSTSTPTFYGIEIVSKKVIFCLDRSSSMSLPVSAEEKKFVITGGPDGRDYEKFDGTKLMLAKVQLKRAIRALPPDAEFNIVFFCHEVEVWKPRLSKATEAARQEAYKYIDEMAGIGTTNIMDPLDMAFRGDGAYAQGPDTVILLTDGLPNEGRIIDQNEIRAEVKRMNRARKIVIHTVGVGDHDRVFMRGLAEENGGKYKGY